MPGPSGEGRSGGGERSLAGAPEADFVLPSHLGELLAGRPHRVVWVNDLGGITLALGAGPSARHLKWAPRSSGIDLTEEIERLAWAGAYTVVPEVLTAGADSVATWFESRSLGADNAIAPARHQDPSATARELGRSLREFHEALPVADCPFSWSVAERLARVRALARSGDLDDRLPSRWFEELTLSAALDELDDAPALDAVVCHGDACAPNTLIDEDGRAIAHVDLGTLGVGDRWADLAVLAWSTVWNFGPGHEESTYEGYGVEPEPDKIRYYRLLWELG